MKTMTKKKAPRPAAAVPAELAEFVEFAAGVFGISVETLTGTGVCRSLLNQRWVAMVTAARWCNADLLQVARAFGRGWSRDMRRAEERCEPHPMQVAVLKLGALWQQHRREAANKAGGAKKTG